MMFAGDPVSSLTSALKSHDYQAIGFSIRNLDDCISSTRKSYFADVSEMVECVLKQTDAPVILGGSGFSISPDGWLKRLNVHYGGVGGGEVAIGGLLYATR